MPSEQFWVGSRMGEKNSIWPFEGEFSSDFFLNSQSVDNFRKWEKWLWKEVTKYFSFQMDSLSYFFLRTTAATEKFPY